MSAARRTARPNAPAPAREGQGVGRPGAAVLRAATFAVAASLAGLPLHAGPAPARPTLAAFAQAQTGTTSATTGSTAGSTATTPGSNPAAAASSSGAAVEISSRAYAIAAKLRCPVCTAESVADSGAEISAEMRQLIQQQLDAGKSEAQIIHYFTQRYGDWILLDPPKRGVHLLVWLLPVLALLGGAGGLALLVRRWRAAAETGPPVDAAALERVRRELDERLARARESEERD